jgi:hypothetical protein
MTRPKAPGIAARFAMLTLAGAVLAAPGACNLGSGHCLNPQPLPPYCSEAPQPFQPGDEFDAGASGGAVDAGGPGFADAGTDAPAPNGPPGDFGASDAGETDALPVGAGPRDGAPGDDAGDGGGAPDAGDAADAGDAGAGGDGGDAAEAGTPL